MVSVETPSENSVPLIYLRCVWVIKSPRVTHSVLYILGLFLLAKLHTFAFEITITAFKQVVTFLG